MLLFIVSLTGLVVLGSIWAEQRKNKNGGETGMPPLKVRVYLRAEPGTMYGLEYPVPDDTKLSVGKLPGDTINFADKSHSVSREHAIIKNKAGQLYVCDCGSINGTYIALPGQNVKQLPPHEDTCAPVGSVIYFAERRNSFRVVAK